jgi:HAD superfamily hydrolase (TIGR01509 family)
MTAKRPIIFWDMMETLVTEPYFNDLPAYFGLTVEELRQQMHPTSWIDFEEGRLTEAEYYRQFFRDGRPLDTGRLRERLLHAYQWLDGMEPLLAQLKQAGYEMHALSNYSTWYLIIEEALQVSRYVEWTFVSCLTGLRKPDPNCYRHATQTLQVAPEECLFVDDRWVNVEAARAVGLDAIIKTTAANLRSELQQRGILH